MQILEHGQAQERTLLFFPNGRASMGLADTITQLSRKWRVFQVIYDGHQPEYPGDFTSVEQTVDEVISYLKTTASPVWTAYGCSMGGACLTRMLALGEMPIGRAIIDGGITPYQLPCLARSCCWCGMCCLSKWRRTAERFLKRLFRRNGLPPRGTTLKGIRRHGGLSQDLL